MMIRTLRSILTIILMIGLSVTVIPFATLSAEALTIVTGSPLVAGIVGKPYSQTFTASGGSPLYAWSIESGSLPDGLFLNSASGTITGTPTTPALALEVNIKVTDNLGAFATKIFTISIGLPTVSIGAPPVIPAGGTLDVSINISWVNRLNTSLFDLSYNPAVIQLAGEEGGPGVTPGLIGGSVLPVDIWDFQPVPGTPSGKIRVLSHMPGVTTATGSGYLAQIHFNVIGAIGQNTNLTLSNVDSVNDSATHQEFDISPPGAVTVGIVITTSSPLPTGETGIAYSQSLSATGGTPPYTWSIDSGVLPAGLSLSAGGTISGIPTTVTGAAIVTIKVTDSVLVTASKEFSVSIAGPPSVKSGSPLPSGEQGIAYAYSLEAEGGVSPYSWSMDNGTLPEGLSLAVNGNISGTPASIGGPTVFTVRVTDNLTGTATKDLSIAIVGPPTITTTSPLPDGAVGTLYEQTLTVSGGLAPFSWSMDNGTLPAGLTLSVDGIISGTPTAITEATVITFRVTDRVGGQASKGLSITIGPMLPLSITTASPLPTGEVGIAYSTKLAATGGFNPYTWTLDNSALPPGLSLSTNGFITGTPTTPGDLTMVTFRATDTLAASVTKTLLITIVPALSITTTSSLPDGAVGTLYEQTLTVSGGLAPFSWSMDNGTLPAGLTLSVDGIISGTPTAITEATVITFRVTDSLGGAAARNISIAVGPMLPLSITTSSPLPTGEVGIAYSTKLAATGGFNPYTWTLDNSALPPGLSLSTDGFITGIPTTVGGPIVVSFKATDTLAASVTKDLSITIVNNPSITTNLLPDGAVGTLYEQTLTASGGLTPYTWSVNAGTLPAGLTLSVDGIISGTPTTVTSATVVTFRVTDSLGGQASKGLSITIGPMLPLSITTASPLPTGEVGIAYSTKLTATGGFNPYTWTLDNSALPPGLSLSTNGFITGTPTTPGDLTMVTFRATDTLAASVTKTLLITIVPALSITTTSPLPDGAVGTLYEQTLTVSGGLAPFSWSMDNGTLPAGLTLSVDGIISGTPTAITEATVITFRVTDSLGGAAARNISIAVGPMLPLSITTSSPLPTGEVGIAYSTKLAATGGFNPYTWTLDNSALPPGLSLSTDGFITGIPTTVGGPVVVFFKATDTLAASVTKDLSITIVNNPSITTNLLPDGAVNVAYSATLSGSGGLPPYTWTVQTGTLPTGLTLTSASGTISGTPASAAGPITITFKLTDSLGGLATRDLTITISSAPSPGFTGGGGGSSVTYLAITSVSPANSATGVAVDAKIMAVFSKTLNSSTVNTTTFTLSSAIGPAAGTVTYNSATNTATFTPASELAYSTLYTATITNSVKDTSNFAMTNTYTWTFTTVPLGKIILTGFTPSEPLDIDSKGIIQTAASLTSLDGRLKLDIAKGAKLLDSAGKPLSSLSVAPTTSPAAPPSGQAVALAYSLGSDGAKFDPALTLIMTYDAGKLPSGMAEKDLYLAYYDGVQWQALESTINTNDHTLTARIVHLTTFAALGKVVIVTPSTTPLPTTPSTTLPPTTPTMQTTTPVITTTTTTPIPTPTIDTPPWGWIIFGIIVAVIIIGVIAVLYIRKRRLSRT